MGTSALVENELRALRDEIKWLRAQGDEVRLGVAAKDAEIRRLRTALSSSAATQHIGGNLMDLETLLNLWLLPALPWMIAVKIMLEEARTYS